MERAAHRTDRYRQLRLLSVVGLLLCAVAAPAAAHGDPFANTAEGFPVGLEHETLAGDAIHAESAEFSGIYDMIFPHLDGTGSYGDTWGAPRSGGRTHQGTDIMAPKMTPIVAVASGTVGWMHDTQGGKCCAMALNHDDGWASWYIHMNNDTPGTDDGQGWGFAPGITSGVHVEAGQLIGWSGDSGNAESTAPHTHFELHRPAEPGETANASGNRVKINPYQHLLQATIISEQPTPQDVRGCDFDGDGYHDLAIGTPGEDLGPTNAKIDAGAVTILYGGSDGLEADGSQRFRQGLGGVDETASKGDRFGEATACGDLDGDGYDDLVVGIPGERVDTINNTGAINVLYGSSEGLQAVGDNFWYMSKTGVPGEIEKGAKFAAALAVADFDGDGYADIAAGVPGATAGGKNDAGSVVIIPGGPQGITGGGQWFIESDSSITGKSERKDGFGSSLTAGDFDGDGRFDLAVGIPAENLRGIADVGSVVVLYGTDDGLTGTGHLRLSQSGGAVSGSITEADRFGAALVAGDFDGDGHDDLFVGVPGEQGGGGGHVVYGSADGLTLENERLFLQGNGGLGGTHEDGDEFGSALAAGDLDQDGFVDVIVGMPGEDIGTIEDAGAVLIIHGGSDGLDTSGDLVLAQDTAGVEDTSEAGDRFGACLTTGDFAGAGVSSLVVGVPDEDRGAAVDGGIVHEFPGGPGGVSTSADRVWAENSSGVPGALEDGDGWAAVAGVSP